MLRMLSGLVLLSAIAWSGPADGAFVSYEFETVYTGGPVLGPPRAGVHYIVNPGDLLRFTFGYETNSAFPSLTEGRYEFPFGGLSLTSINLSQNRSLFFGGGGGNWARDYITLGDNSAGQGSDFIRFNFDLGGRGGGGYGFIEFLDPTGLALSSTALPTDLGFLNGLRGSYLFVPAEGFGPGGSFGPPASVPEPSSWALTGLGMVLLGGLSRARRSRGRAGTAVGL